MQQFIISLILAFITISLFGQDDKKVIVKIEKHVVVDVENEGDSGDAERTIIIKTIEDGEEKVLEWDGEGEMPEDMKKMMKDHDIDLSEIHKGAKGMKMKMKMMKKHRDHEGRLHENHRGKGHGGHCKMWIEKSHKMSDTYMGAQIASEENGVKVIDVMVDGPAHKAGLKKGDIITELNGANTKRMEDLLTLLNFYDVGDSVEIKYHRDNKTRTTRVKLAKRPEAYR